MVPTFEEVNSRTRAGADNRRESSRSLANRQPEKGWFSSEVILVGSESHPWVMENGRWSMVDLRKHRKSERFFSIIDHGP
jgi:hypothetical protein